MCILCTIFIKLVGTKCKDSYLVHTSMGSYNILLDVDCCIVTVESVKSFDVLRRTFHFLSEIFFACKNRAESPGLRRTVNREINFLG